VDSCRQSLNSQKSGRFSSWSRRRCAAANEVSDVRTKPLVSMWRHVARLPPQPLNVSQEYPGRPHATRDHRLPGRKASKLQEHRILPYPPAQQRREIVTQAAPLMRSRSLLLAAISGAASRPTGLSPLCVGPRPISTRLRLGITLANLPERPRAIGKIREMRVGVFR